MPHTPDTHSTHDPLPIAAYAAGDATGEELATSGPPRPFAGGVGP